MSLNLWKAALPQSRAFSLIINKTLRRFYEGLTYPQYYRDLFDATYKQLDPQVTGNLLRWEEQFYLPNTGLTEQQRRDRLEATWKMTGGQSPAYLQSILRGYGFDVYVHDWWMPEEQITELTMGGDNSFMGGDSSFMGAKVATYPVAWNPNDILLYPHYPLVNKISSTSYQQVGMGGDQAFMGGGDAFMGHVVATEPVESYPLPTDQDKWRYFFYIAGENMPDPATVPISRKSEFEELILAIFPAHLWGGIIVEYEGMASTDRFPFFLGTKEFSTGLDDQLIDFVTSLTNEGLPIDSYTACKFEFRETNALNSPAIGSPLLGTIEMRVDPDDSVSKNAAVLVMTDAKKVEILGGLQTRTVFGAFILTNGAEEFPLWYANVKITGVS